MEVFPDWKCIQPNYVCIYKHSKTSIWQMCLVCVCWARYVYFLYEVWLSIFERPRLMYLCIIHITCWTLEVALLMRTCVSEINFFPTLVFHFYLFLKMEMSFFPSLKCFNKSPFIFVQTHILLCLPTNNHSSSFCFFWEYHCHAHLFRVTLYIFCMLES